MRTGSILRKRRASEKVYVPKEARDNQYVIAEMPLTDKLIELVVGKIDLSSEQPYQKFYQKLAKLAFDVVEEYDISHANFVANNRLVRVRYSQEQQVLHTEQQSFFFYSPEHNSTFKGYYDAKVRSNKVKFLFLAIGNELRVNSGEFHDKVYRAVQEISKRIGLAPDELKMRDHQHLTYDIFAKEKGKKDSITHTFREISARYLQQGYEIKGKSNFITYAVVSIPMSRRLLKNVELDYEAKDVFAPLYEKVAQVFKSSADKHDLTQAAMIANGNSVIVRYDENENTLFNGEIISLGFNPKNDKADIVCLFEPEKLVDNIRLVFFATEFDETHKTYGKFVNQVTKAINTLANELDWNKERDYMLMRLHQQVVRRV